MDLGFRRIRNEEKKYDVKGYRGVHPGSCELFFLRELEISSRSPNRIKLKP